uniref:Transmembrane 9 superfamily member 5 isoform X2 n=1 Tax=Rhizophora mucronata TaxID=61149 RepID=A0A2P2JY41_RHIMU
MPHGCKGRVDQQTPRQIKGKSMSVVEYLCPRQHKTMTCFEGMRKHPHECVSNQSLSPLLRPH